jgi:hypothetical protein
MERRTASLALNLWIGRVSPACDIVILEAGKLSGKVKAEGEGPSPELKVGEKPRKEEG